MRKIDSSGVIRTIAGSGVGGFSGDGGPATAARLRDILGVAVDRAGNVYVSDSGNNRVRKIDTAGIIQTIAGTGTAGFAGDGGLATAAQLRSPAGVAVDSSGNVLIADQINSRVRKIDATTGIISTIAGTAAGAGFSGDGGPSTAARVNLPLGVAIDASDNIYIADTFNRRIRKIDAISGTIQTIAGNGTQGSSGNGGPATAAQLVVPLSVAVDRSGNVYIADSEDQRVRKVDSRGTIVNFAGTGNAGYSGEGGPATVAQLTNPRGVAVNAAGVVYITDSGNNRIRKVG